MRIRTAAPRKAIDRLKDKIESEAARFSLSMGAILVSFTSVPRGRSLFALSLVLATMVNFVFSEFALLALLCFLAAKLHWRLAPYTP